MLWVSYCVCFILFVFWLSVFWLSVLFLSVLCVSHSTLGWPASLDYGIFVRIYLLIYYAY